MREEALIKLFMSEQYELCYRLMKGLKIEFLNLDMEKLRFNMDESFAKEFYPNGARHLKVGIFYYDHHSKILASKDPETFAVTFWDNGDHYHDMLKLAERKGLGYLKEYYSDDPEIGFLEKGFRNLPKEELLKLIFKPVI